MNTLSLQKVVFLRKVRILTRDKPSIKLEFTFTKNNYGEIINLMNGCYFENVVKLVRKDETKFVKAGN